MKLLLKKDMDYSKVGMMIKDHFEFRRVFDLLLEHACALKDIFTHCIALSSYPSITWIDFYKFCSEWKIPDKKTCTLQTIDRLFIITNVEVIEQEDNPDRDLCRYEFFEIILRLAGAKFKDSNRVKTWDEAAERLIVEHIIPNAYQNFIMTGKEFRLENIWILAIDDLFRANIDNIKIIYNKFTNGMKKHINVDDLKEIVEILEISTTEFKISYAFCKTTIIDEM